MFYPYLRVHAAGGGGEELPPPSPRRVAEARRRLADLEAGAAGGAREADRLRDIIARGEPAGVVRPPSPAAVDIGGGEALPPLTAADRLMGLGATVARPPSPAVVGGPAGGGGAPRFDVERALFLLACIAQGYNRASNTRVVVPPERSLIFDSENMMVFRTDTTGTLYMAFRGTMTGEEWKRNFTFKTASTPLFPGIGDSHSGFIDHYVSVIHREIEGLRATFDFTTAPKIYVTGHSAGSTYATLCAFDLLRNFHLPVEKLEVYTFASPRVGGPEFKAVYDVLGLGERTFRVFNTFDIVPLVPFGSLTLFEAATTPLILLVVSIFFSPAAAAAVIAGRRAANYAFSKSVYAHVGIPVEINLTNCGPTSRAQRVLRSHVLDSGYFTPLLQALNFTQQIQFQLKYPPGFLPPIMSYCSLNKRLPFTTRATTVSTPAFLGSMAIGDVGGIAAIAAARAEAEEVADIRANPIAAEIVEEGKYIYSWIESPKGKWKKVKKGLRPVPQAAVPTLPPSPSAAAGVMPLPTEGAALLPLTMLPAFAAVEEPGAVIPFRPTPPSPRPLAPAVKRIPFEDAEWGPITARILTAAVSAARLARARSASFDDIMKAAESVAFGRPLPIPAFPITGATKAKTVPKADAAGAFGAGPIKFLIFRVLPPGAFVPQRATYYFQLLAGGTPIGGLQYVIVWSGQDIVVPVPTNVDALNIEWASTMPPFNYYPVSVPWIDDEILCVRMNSDRTVVFDHGSCQ